MYLHHNLQLKSQKKSTNATEASPEPFSVINPAETTLGFKSKLELADSDLYAILLPAEDCPTPVTEEAPILSPK